MSRLGRTLLYVMCTLIGVLLILPLLAILPLAFTAKSSFKFPPESYSTRWFENFFQSSVWTGALVDTIIIALSVAVLCTVLGTLAAIGVRRLGRTAATVVSLSVISAMIVPAVVIGVGIYGFLGQLRLLDSIPGFIIAHSILGLPFVFITVSANLSVYDHNLELAAEGLGASRFDILKKVTLPLLIPGVLAGAVFALEISFDEVVMSTFLAGSHVTTLPVQMWTSVARGLDPTVAAASALLILLVTMVVAAVAVSGRLRKTYSEDK